MRVLRAFKQKLPPRPSPLAVRCAHVGGGGRVGALTSPRCLASRRRHSGGAEGGEAGFHVGADIGPYVLPGGNYHVYDYSLFWANIRADVEARLSTFGAARMAAP